MGSSVRPSVRPSVFLSFRPSVDTMRWVVCGRNSSYSFQPIFLKLCRCFCHGLKMCIWFWGYPLVVLCQLFSLFRVFFFFFFFFSGQITIRIETFCAQLRLEFSTDHFETMHTCSTWPLDVHVVLDLSSSYFLSTFSSFSA